MSKALAHTLVTTINIVMAAAGYWWLAMCTHLLTPVCV